MVRAPFVHRILARLGKLERKDIGENVEELPLELGPTSIGFDTTFAWVDGTVRDAAVEKEKKKKIIRAVVGKGLERRK